MKCKIQFGILATVLTAAVILADSNYLAEKPAIFQPCKQTDPSFNRCFANNFQVVFTEWKDGVPGLKTVGSLEPLYIKRISVVQDNNNAVAQLNLDLSDIHASGISNLKVQEAIFDSHKMVTKLRMFAPKLEIDSQYATKGHILNLVLNGNGHSAIRIDDVEVIVAVRLKRRDEHDNIFSDIDKLRLEITKIGGFHIQLDNLFNGQKELEDSANAVINQNWRALYEVLGPAIKNAIQTVLTDRLKKVFAYVPVTYFIEDF